ncbi:hypothetical protein HH1059_04120 [Halorhodospira halochloris]|uniref:Uncharacterized protein n=1 Tax=Halorhodospira halochloris TaxID=1052 RepID=A0A2Z6EZC0_HALHR|nr:hypothetical protein HH1059_04120 [Halorhodospira halochloris]
MNASYGTQVPPGKRSAGECPEAGRVVLDRIIAQSGKVAPLPSQARDPAIRAHAVRMDDLGIDVVENPIKPAWAMADG